MAQKISEKTSPKPNGINKARRPFGDPVSYSKANPRFTPIPATYKMPADLTMDLANIVPAQTMKNITAGGKLVFHVAGDTGGISGTQIQSALAEQMEAQITSAATGSAPGFFYHLGDVVYFNGISTDYDPQFYEPYQYYPAPIVAIPGNHDCDNLTRAGDPSDPEPSMTGFMSNFCNSATPFNSPYRKALNQPWPYWTLNTPFATFIGLFSNVDGSLDAAKGTAQYDWFVAQLKAAPNNKCLIVSLHHPCFSLDTAHGGYPGILATLDKAFAAAKRNPDIVFSGHVHDYQRFTRTLGSAQIPYVIAGAAGYATTLISMHKVQKDPKTNAGIVVPFQTTRKDVVLSKYNDANPGFLRITIDAQFLTGEYFTNTFDGSTAPVNAYDIFKLDWKKNTLVVA